VTSSQRWLERIRGFAVEECRGTSPLYEAIGLALAQDAEMLDWLAAVCGPRARATLPFAAVHYLLLSAAPAGDLRRFYPSLVDEPAPPGSETYPAFRSFCVRERDRLNPLLAGRVTQTNEVARCGYLLPAFTLVAELSAKPLSIVEVGCSAGLNLLFDLYGYDFGGGRAFGNASSPVRLKPTLGGSRMPAIAMPAVSGRVGIDLEPVDLESEDAVRWLQACIWPEHVDRMRNLRAAIEIARSQRPHVVKGNAVELLTGSAMQADANAALVVVNTNVMLYFSAEERARYAQLLIDLSAAREVFWIANEHPALLSSAGFVAPMELSTDGSLPLVMSRIFRGRRDDRVLAIVGAHARWIEWRA
jgi:hypothetical protein